MTIPLAQRFAVLDRDGYRCQFCGRVAPETELEVDHLHPRSKGGSDLEANLVTACRDCNRGKGDRIVRLPSRRSWGSLAGKFCHILDPEDGCVQKQARVESVLSAELLVLTYFEWFTGSISTTKVEHLDDLVRRGLVLYETDEEMRECYEYEMGVRRKKVA